MLRLELLDRRPRSRPKRRFMDVDIKVVGMSKEAEDRARLSQMTPCGDQ